MQINFLRANCLKFKINNVSLVIDDNLKQLKGKSVAQAQDVVCITNPRLIDQPKEAKLILDMPGSYEVGSVFINGIATKSFKSAEDNEQSVIYKIMSDNLSAVVLGHIQPNLTDEQLEAIGLVDILFVPIGGGDYTLDSEMAAQITKSINPRVVIPTHYKQSGIKYEVDQDSYDDFIKTIGLEPEFIDNAYKPKPNTLSEQLSLKILK